MDKLIITAALTGAETTKEANPALPVTPQEIIESACRSAEAGASIVHLHARNPDGSSTQAVEVYEEIITGIRERSDVIVQVSTGGAVGMTSRERLQPVTLKPDMATLSTGSVNFGDDLFVNTMEDIRIFAKTMVELESNRKLRPLTPGWFKTPYPGSGGISELPCTLILSKSTRAMPGTPEALMYMQSLLPPVAPGPWPELAGPSFRWASWP